MNVDYKKLGENEDILTFINEHWIVFLSPVSLYLVGNALGIFLAWLGIFSVGLYELTGLILSFIALLVLLVTQHWFFMALISLELSGWAVTSERIIDFSFLPYVRHDMLYINIRDINEIEKRQHGILRNILHYGDVEITLASSPKPILFRFFPFPGRFVDLVSRLQKGSR